MSKAVIEGVALVPLSLALRVSNIRQQCRVGRVGRLLNNSGGEALAHRDGSHRRVTRVNRDSRIRTQVTDANQLRVVRNGTVDYVVRALICVVSQRVRVVVVIDTFATVQLVPAPRSGRPRNHRDGRKRRYSRRGRHRDCWRLVGNRDGDRADVTEAREGSSRHNRQFTSRGHDAARTDSNSGGLECGLDVGIRQFQVRQLFGVGDDGDVFTVCTKHRGVSNAVQLG